LVGIDGASSRLDVALQPARQHPHRMQPSYSVSHPVGAGHRALGGAQQPDWVRILSEKERWSRALSSTCVDVRRRVRQPAPGTCQTRRRRHWPGAPRVPDWGCGWGCVLVHTPPPSCATSHPTSARHTPIGRQHLSRCCSSRQQPQLWESALEQVPSGAMSQPCYV
jgi:hypothetical protein